MVGTAFRGCRFVEMWRLDMCIVRSVKANRATLLQEREKRGASLPSVRIRDREPQNRCQYGKPGKPRNTRNTRTPRAPGAGLDFSRVSRGSRFKGFLTLTLPCRILSSHDSDFPHDFGFEVTGRGRDFQLSTPKAFGARGARTQRGKAATKGFEQEQTEETEKETESRKIFVENAQLWWMALQRRKEMAHKLDMRLPGSCDFAPLRLCVKTLPHGCGLWRGLSWV